MIVDIYILAVLVSNVYTLDIHYDENDLEELCIKTVNGFQMSSSEELKFRNFVSDLINEKELRKV